MRVHVPDPDYSSSGRAKANFLLAVKLTLGFLAVMWAVFVIDQLFNLELIRFGLRPREGAGLLGLITTPLLHFNLAHILSNSFPLLVGGTVMLFLYPNAALRALPILIIGTGAIAWAFARPNVHIGASGLVYGILAFVFVSGILRRDLRSIGAALMIWFLYGSMIWGVLPAGRSMSWELHLSGFMLGIVLAAVFRSWDIPPLKRYEWEDEQQESAEDFDDWRQGNWKMEGDESRSPRERQDEEWRK